METKLILNSKRWIELFIFRLSFLIYTEIQIKNFEKSVNVLQ